MDRIEQLEAHAQSLRQLITADEHCGHGLFLDQLDDLIEHLTERRAIRCAVETCQRRSR